MRTTFDGEIRCDTWWRTALTPQQLAYFEKRAGWLNRRFGYTD